jgi:hypothetical protein
MFAPKPFDVAKEMVRVTRPGGRVVMGNWISQRSDTGRPDSEDQLLVLAATARRLHQPDDVGDREPRHRTLCRRGNSRQRRISFVKDTFTFNFSGPPAEFVTRFRIVLRSDDERIRCCAKESDTRTILQRELEALFSTQKHEPHPDATSIPATFLRVSVAV